MGGNALASDVFGDRLAVNLPDAGKLLGVSAKTVWREIDRGALRGLKVGRQWRVRVAELKEYLLRKERENLAR